MVSLIGLTEFTTKSGLIDNKNLKAQDIDRMFMAARHEDAEGAKSQNMVRFMFFEAFARIGLQRYYNTGSGFFSQVKPECASPAEAIAKSFATLK